MGDMKTSRSLGDKIANREARKQETVHSGNETIDNLSRKPGGKDKLISARVNSATYDKFKRICEARGLASNSCLNMLITDFVRENKSVIEE